MDIHRRSVVMASDIKSVRLGKMENPVRGFVHGTAALASAVGAVFLWIRGSGDPSRQVVLLIFALSLVSLYTVSTLYHSIPWRRVWKERMRRIDHSMIYVLVAGTYTPTAFLIFDGWVRSATLAIVWGIAVVGIVQKACVPRVGSWFSITMQTTQGWIALLLVVPLSQRLPGPALLLMVLGGVFYTVGMVSLVAKRPRLRPGVFSYHEVFHIFVVAGSAAHYMMTFWYVAPFLLS
jgi:hemolysin III